MNQKNSNHNVAADSNICNSQVESNTFTYTPHLTAESADTTQSSILHPQKHQSSDFGGQILVPEDDDTPLALRHNTSQNVRINVEDIPPYKTFTFRKLWAFTGPGFLMSIAYLDPGNIESDLRSGSLAQYRLLWVLLLATILGLVVQCLAIRLGVVTGKGLAEVCGQNYGPIPRYALWLMIECAIVGSDVQEVIGTAVAFHLLSRTRIPLYGGVLLTIIDTFTFLTLDKYGMRKLELFFVSLIAIMAATFGYHYIVVAPDQLQILRGLFVPGCPNCSHEAILQAVGIIGAVIMPHNLFLHSALVKSRAVDRTRRSKVRQANFYFGIEAAFALGCSFVINLFVVSVFAKGLYGVTNADVGANCVARSGPAGPDSLFPGTAAMFPNDTSPVQVDLFRGALFLGCQFGVPSLYIWAIGIMAAGQSATMTGTYAGQFVMQGFLDLRLTRVKRILLTRSIAIGPTLLLALTSDLAALTNLNDALNVLQSFQLPFAIVPLLTFTSSSGVMGPAFVNSRLIIIIVLAIAAVVFGANALFIVTLFRTLASASTAIGFGLALLICAYLSFLLYLCYRGYLMVSGTQSPFPATCPAVRCNDRLYTWFMDTFNYSKRLRFVSNSGVSDGLHESVINSPTPAPDKISSESSDTTIASKAKFWHLNIKDKFCKILI